MATRPNFLLITADDMNWDAVGAFGCRVAGSTPNLDRLASEGMCFHHAHVTIAVSQPSRSTLMTGRYPHRHTGEGFFHLRQPGVPILPDLLRQAGYLVGILGKYSHSTPYADFQWDLAFDQKDLGHGRDPQQYRRHLDSFLARARQANKPFFMMANSHDPHRPFYGNDDPQWYQPGDTPPAAVPSRTFTPGEMAPPGFLADLPDVRLELSEYHNSVRRCDDTVGAILDALDRAGLREQTVVVFLSDNGMAFPFAKTNCYLHSTRTPWITRWPGVIEPGRYEREHFISGIDLLPTFLDAAGVTLPAGVDGRSFVPVLRGRQQAGRDVVFTQFHQTAGKGNYPMRCVQNHRFGYIFNPWSNGRRVFRNESQAGRTMNALRTAAERDTRLAARVQLFLYRVVEELYDFANDPDALHNLAGDPAYAQPLHDLRLQLQHWMQATADPALGAFLHRASEPDREQYMQEMAALVGGQ